MISEYYPFIWAFILFSSLLASNSKDGFSLSTLLSVVVGGLISTIITDLYYKKASAESKKGNRRLNCRNHGA